MFETEQTFEDIVLTKLINIESRLSRMETNMIWVKNIGKVGLITIGTFFGINFTGVI